MCAQHHRQHDGAVAAPASAARPTRAPRAPAAIVAAGNVEVKAPLPIWADIAINDCDESHEPWCRFGSSQSTYWRGREGDAQGPAQPVEAQASDASSASCVCRNMGIATTHGESAFEAQAGIAFDASKPYIKQAGKEPA